MDRSQFDSVTRFFAARKNRREALGAAGAGIAALGVAGIAAHDATPEASPVAVPVEGSGTEFLFVQTLGAGSLAPASEGDGTMVLTADHLAGQTLYFSDRPERIVGMAPTEQFLGASGTGGLGFTPSDPPNAALVFGGSDGAADQVAVVELIDPRYDAASGQVTYTVKLLDDVSQVDMTLEQTPVTVTDAVQEFTAASLFIDDCPDGEVYCSTSVDNTVNVYNSGFCWDTLNLCCYACAANSLQWWTDYCNQNNPGCNGQCYAAYRETWACPD
jgi:hypothetical protein